MVNILIWLYAQVLDIQSKTLDFVREEGLTVFNEINDYDKPGEALGIHQFCLLFNKDLGATFFKFRLAPGIEVVMGNQKTLVDF